VDTNQFCISARLLECDAIRYTPSGVPALNCRLEHTSSVTEAGVLRQVKLSLKCVSFDSVAETLVVQEIGSCWRFDGFLANPKNSKQVVFHIQKFEKI
jgi:primosomal replication protein N